MHLNDLSQSGTLQIYAAVHMLAEASVLQHDTQWNEDLMSLNPKEQIWAQPLLACLVCIISGETLQGHLHDMAVLTVYVWDS